MDTFIREIPDWTSNQQIAEIIIWCFAGRVDASMNKHLVLTSGDRFISQSDANEIDRILHKAATWLFFVLQAVGGPWIKPQNTYLVGEILDTKQEPQEA